MKSRYIWRHMFSAAVAVAVLKISGMFFADLAWLHIIVFAFAYPLMIFWILVIIKVTSGFIQALGDFILFMAGGNPFKENKIKNGDEQKKQDEPETADQQWQKKFDEVKRGAGT